MTHLSLFSGIGGDSLAAHAAGFKTVQFVEIDPFCQAVLNKNFPKTPVHDDIRTFDSTPYRDRIDLLSGGFPCQDISIAGNQAGLEGSRSILWFDMLRVISEIRPTWAVVENVAALLGMGIDLCLHGLESEGYSTRTVVLPACGVGACHRRARVFIIANTGREPSTEASSGTMPERAERRTRDDATSGSLRPFAPTPWRSWGIEPVVRRSNDGLSRKLDVARLRSLGNAIVPQQVFPIFAAIREQLN